VLALSMKLRLPGSSQGSGLRGRGKVEGERLGGGTAASVSQVLVPVCARVTNTQGPLVGAITRAGPRGVEELVGRNGAGSPLTHFFSFSFSVFFFFSFFFVFRIQIYI
jgi:hypothetical protein